jgi:capsular exopolysaccharide synthesis family protein
MLALTAILAVAAAGLWVWLAPARFEATATLREATAAGAPASRVGYDDVIYADRMLSTYEALAKGEPLRAELAAALGLARPPAVDVHIPANTELIELTASGPTPEEAARAANTLAGLLIERAQALASNPGEEEALGQLALRVTEASAALESARAAYASRAAEQPRDNERMAIAGRELALREDAYLRAVERYREGDLTRTVRAQALELITPATPDRASAATPAWLVLVLAAVLGLGGGVGVVLLAEGADPGLYSVEQIEAAAGGPALAAIPAGPREAPAVADAFRGLCAALLGPGRAASLRTVVVAGVAPDAGASAVVAGLGSALAQRGRRALLVDADLRAPRLHSLLGLPNELGLNDMLTRNGPHEGAIQCCGQGGFAVLTAGQPAPEGVDLLGSPALAALLGELAQRFETILIDSPPVAGSADALALAGQADGVVLVVRGDRARQRAVREAARRLAVGRANTLGVVITSTAG